MAYLEEAIDSIVAQTYHDWELIVVDNASSDDSVAYLEARAAEDPRIRILSNPDDVGVGRSLNKGLSFCRGQWIARIDADDRALPERFERQMAFLRENPDVIVLSCFAYYINPQGKRILRAPHDLTSREAYHHYMATDEVIGILHPGSMIRRDELIAAGSYRPEYEPAEDTDLWNRLSERGVVMVLPEYLMEYRLHDTSVLARSMEAGHRKREWVKASLRARRAGLPEPTWEEAQKTWRAAPVVQRIDRRRRILVDNMLRNGRQQLAGGRVVNAYVRFGVAAMLRPVYTTPRLLRHLNASCGRTRSDALKPVWWRKAGEA
jgi:glycosyltransferase involved in cell wall biosynthesis